MAKVLCTTQTNAQTSQILECSGSLDYLGEFTPGKDARGETKASNLGVKWPLTGLFEGVRTGWRVRITVGFERDILETSFTISTKDITEVSRSLEARTGLTGEQQL